MRKVVFTILVGLTFLNSSVEASSIRDIIDINDDTKEVIKEVAKEGVKVVAQRSAVPLSVYGAGSLGLTANTGTAISTLSGIAATNATLYAIGSGASTVIAGITGITVAPVVVGGAIVTGITISIVDYICD